MAADPEGAAQLLAQAQAAERNLHPTMTTGMGGRVQESYDPMRLYARMAKYYGWSHNQIDAMHFVTFFGYVREAQIMLDEEKATYTTPAANGQAVTPEQAAMVVSDLPQVLPYEGETVSL